jgi:hypothetical protein
MKKTILTSIALAACVSTPLFAQNTKEDTITFALTASGQSSVSQTTGNNVGTWVDATTGNNPFHYKTATKKLTQTDILKSIAIVLHGNAGYYSSKAKLVLVQGELSGFFNINSDLAKSTANFPLDGTFTDLTGDSATSIGNSTDSCYVQLATGRHYETNPISGQFPTGHHQPWGQIFVKDTLGGTQVCDNVSFFFGLTVQECYDCFYMNSFISDANFTEKSGTATGPVCCTVSSSLLGKGKDQYYMTLSFDNTTDNDYLNDEKDYYVGVDGLAPFVGALDGTTPDGLAYVNAIQSGLGKASPYEMRFELNGIAIYTWSLTFVNKSDALPDFVGNAKYTANGFGFIGLVCDLLNGTVSFSEKSVKETGCCLDTPWYGDDTTGSTWYGLDFSQDYYSTPVNVDASLTWHNNHGEE